MIVAILMFALVFFHIRGRPGRAWAAIRQSESAALAAGINTTFYKLWAFALASFVTGVAGGLVAGSFRYLNSLTFTTQDSITLLAVVLMGGAYSMTGAVIAAFLLKFLQALLNDWGVSPDWLTILFGIGVLQVLTTAPRGIVEQFPRDMARLGRSDRRIVPPKRPRPRSRPNDRGLRTDSSLRRRHPAGRDGRQVRVRHVRADRAQRGRQDDVLQRAQRLRAPGHRDDRRVRGEPPEDGPLPSRPVGRAAHVPDRAGDRGAVDLRQRRDGPRAVQGLKRLAPRGDARSRSSSSASSPTRTRR